MEKTTKVTSKAKDSKTYPAAVNATVKPNTKRFGRNPYPEEDTEPPNYFDKIKALFSGRNAPNKNTVDDLIVKEVKSGNIDKELASGFDIKRGKDFPVTDKSKVFAKDNPFQVEVGTTSEIAARLHAKNPDAKFCVQIYADHTYYGCGLSEHWTTQEEATLRDVNPTLHVMLMEQKLINLIKWGRGSKYIRFKYNEKIKDPISTSEGYIVPAQFCLSNLKLLPEPFETDLLFTSFPSLTDSKNSFDEEGNVSWSYLYRKTKKPNIKKEDIRDLIHEIYHRKINNELKIKLNEEKFRKALILLMFQDDLQVGEKDFPVEKLVDTVEFVASMTTTVEEKLSDEDRFEAGEKLVEEAEEIVEDPQWTNRRSYKKRTTLTEADIAKLKMGGDAIFEKAKKNYAATLKRVVCSWVIMAREIGVEYFIGGPIGCGAFFNYPDIVSHVIAKAFVKYGGDMKFIYGSYDGKKDKKVEIFEKAFKVAMEKMQAKEEKEKEDPLKEVSGRTRKGK